MPSLSEATKKPSNLDTDWVHVPAPPLMPIPPPNYDANQRKANPRVIGTLPSFATYPQISERNFFRAGMSQITLPPLPVQANIAVGAQARSAAQAVIQQAAANSALFETNGVTNPNQTVLNLVGSGVSYGPGPGQVSIGDGLIHGELPWATDPAAVVLQDEFLSGTVTNGQIGSLGWGITSMVGGAGDPPYMCSGAFPYAGEFCIAASSSANTGSTLIPNYGATVTVAARMLAPFVGSPSWKMAWVFRFMPNLRAGVLAGFDLTNRATYIGLGTPVAEANTFAQRPFNFVGLRFDQDTTAPSIGDTTFKFEVLQNGPVGSITTRTSSNGVNNQGGATFSITSVSCTSNVITITVANTLQANSMVTFSKMTTSTFLNGVTANVVSASSSSFTINYTHANFSATTETGTATLGGSVTDTGMTPTIGKFYRFEMSCSVVGQVDMSLSDGTTTFMATEINVPQYVFSLAAGTAGWTFSNDFAGEFRLQTAALGSQEVGAWGSGSKLAFSNFTSSAAVYNGDQTVFDFPGTTLIFLTSTATGTLSNQGGTVAGYPCHFIQAGFGTTTSGTGTEHCALHIDFFSFAWNPAVNGGAGSPNSVKPRYW